MYYLISEFYCYIDRVVDSVSQGTAISGL